VSQVLLLLLVVVTSAGAYGFGRRWLRIEAPLGRGIQRTVETVGVAVAFFVVNVGLTVVGTLALRSLGFFVSLYVATDYTLIVLSFLQAVVFQYWRYAGAAKEQV
jgi:hypothetical protein